MLHRPALLAVAVAGAVLATASPALAHDTGAHYTRAALQSAPAEQAQSSKAMASVANLQYDVLPGNPAALGDSAPGQNGTDIEFMTLAGRDYALAGTGRNGMQIVDITDPTTPTPTAVYDCPINQGDVQVFRRGDRVLATYTADQRISRAPGANGTRSATDQAQFDSACVTEANDLGAEIAGGESGTFLVDLTDPANPFTVSFIEIPKGSHNQTVHPSGNFLYNSNSDIVISSQQPEITIHDISDPENPVFVRDFDYSFGKPALGVESHDVFFNGIGDRAYIASLGSTVILDTTDPAEPILISQFIDEGNSLVHQSDVVSLPTKAGQTRDLLITTDEMNGAAANTNCPGGGLHVYDITGDKEQDPMANKLGTWFIPAASAADNPEGGACTSHVLRLYPDQAIMTIAWYTQGVRTLDISGLAEFQPRGPGNLEMAFGSGIGMTEVGNFVFPDADTWSFKTNRIDTDGSFFGYGNDIARGLDVYEFEGPLLGGRQVPALEPEDFAPEPEPEPAPSDPSDPSDPSNPSNPSDPSNPSNPSQPTQPAPQPMGDCSGVPVATAYVDRDQAREEHKRSIDCVIARDIARGSVDDNGQKVYRPTEDVTREQMARFIVNTLRASGTRLPEPKANAFDDIADSFHREQIETLAAAGIVEGKSGGTSYGPKDTVTRQQMASFVVRAAQFAVEPDLVESGERRFTDVPDGGVHSEAIAIGDDNALFRGTTATTFSPTVVVKRDQMASFLTNLLGVTKDGNRGPAGNG